MEEKKEVARRWRRAGRWADEKKRRWHVRTSRSPPEAYRPLFTATCHVKTRGVKLRLYGSGLRDTTEIR